MLAVSISNALPAPTPVAVGVASTPTTERQSPAFAALFQIQLKAPNGPARPAAPGKPKDSSRAPDPAAGPANSPQVTSPLSIPVIPSWVAPAHAPAVPVNPAPFDSTSMPDRAAPPASEPGLYISSALSVPAGAPSQTLGPVSIGAARIALKPADPSSAPRPSIAESTILTGAAQGFGSPSIAVSQAAPIRGIAEEASPEVKGVSSNASIPVETLPIEADIAPSPIVTAPDIETGPQDADESRFADSASGGSLTRGSENSGTAIATEPTGNAAPNATALPTIRVLQAARAGLDFMKLQIDGGASAPANSFEPRPQPGFPGDGSHFTSQFQTGASAAITTTVAQTANKTSATASVPASDFRDSLQSQATNVAQPALNEVANLKADSKDPSGGSQDNDTNAKSDHPTNSADVRAGGNGFGQTLATAGASAGSGQAASTNSAGAAVNLQALADPRAAIADAKAESSDATPPTQSPTLSDTSATDQPVVSVARITDVPGQTEIRIEMQAGSLGAVELRAHLSGDQIGASIAVEHQDAQLMLTNDLPALHTALAERNLNVNTLNVSQGMGTSSGGGQTGAGQQGFVPYHSKPVYVTPEETSVSTAEPSAETLEKSHGHSRLSVLA